MVLKNKQTVTNVVSAMVDSRNMEFSDMQTEFERSSLEIRDLIESWKRKIIEAGSITNYQHKRPKSYNDHVHSKENVHPNTKTKTNANANANTMKMNVAKQVHAGTKRGSDLKEEAVGEVFIEAKKEEEKIDVNSMKVVELREFLRDRQLDDQGLKKTLQLRLQAHIDEQIEQSNKQLNQNQTPEVSETAMASGSNEIVDEASEGATREIVGLDADKDSVVHAGICAGPEAGVDPDVEMTEHTSSESAPFDNVSAGSSSSEKSDVSMTESSDSDCNLVKFIPTDATISSADSTEQDLRQDSEPESIAREYEMQTTDSAHNMNCAKVKNSSKKNIGRKLLKATSKMFSPGKLKKSPKKGIKKKDVDHTVHQVVSFDTDTGSYGGMKDEGEAEEELEYPAVAHTAPSTSNIGKYEKAATELIGESNDKVGELRVESLSTASTAASTVQSLETHGHNGELKQKEPPQPIVSTPAVPTKIAGKVFSSSTAQAKKREIDKARKARMEKIRNKVKKNQESAIKPPPALSTMKQSCSSTSSHESAEDRKKAIDAKLRQKLAEGKPQTVASTPSQSTAVLKQQKKPDALSPRDTYEMSDRDESDSGSESDEYEDRSSNKKIPKWASKQYLLPALQRQFLDGPEKLDPDKIFPEVSSCDLEAIFGQKKKRYMKRASTGDWRADRVTASEKLVYKRRMGFKK